MNLLNDLTWAFLQPGGIILILLLLSFVLLTFGATSLGRRLLGLCLILAVLPALLPLETILARPLETRLSAPNPLPERIDGIIVLGGSVEWSESRGWQQLNVNDAAERIMAGAALAKRYPEAKLVLTGLYQDVIPNEFLPVATDKSFFFGSEYNHSITFLGEARSTYEEALLSLQTLQPKAGERWLLVTSAYHMPRAYLSFKAQGWAVIPYPVDYRSTGKLELNPSLNFIGKLADMDEVVREWGALFVYNRLGRTEKLLP